MAHMLTTDGYVHVVFALGLGDTDVDLFVTFTRRREFLQTVGSDTELTLWDYATSLNGEESIHSVLFVSRNESMGERSWTYLPALRGSQRYRTFDVRTFGAPISGRARETLAIRVLDYLRRSLEAGTLFMGRLT